MNNDIVYHDNLMEISNEKIIFKAYYFPSMKPKDLFVSCIEKMEVKEPSLRTGKYRIQGTGDLRTWYALNESRHKRDKIFIIKIKNKWIRIGFTGENSKAIENFFKDKGLLS
jgi:hypothetical protein